MPKLHQFADEYSTFDRLGCLATILLSSPPTLPDEAQRLATLDQYEGVQQEARAVLDRFANLGAMMFGVPLALVTFVRGKEQFFAGRFGMTMECSPRDLSFCAHAIAGRDVFSVCDARLDPRFSDNPVVQDQPGVRFYAGAPLIAANGHHLGTFCIVDVCPREPLTDSQSQLLRQLAAMTVYYMDELRLHGRSA